MLVDRLGRGFLFLWVCIRYDYRIHCTCCSSNTLDELTDVDEKLLFVYQTN